MASKAWKTWERQLAVDLGGQRAGPLGYDCPDVLGLDDLAVEAKYMQKLQLRDDHMAQAKRNARGKPWALCIREAKTGRRVVVLDYQHFLNLYRGSA